jgi:hypothetical protein
MRAYYRFRRRWPNKLNYRDAVVVFEVASRASNMPSLPIWVLQARKVGFTTAPCEIFSLMMPRNIFEHALMEGFPIDTESPAGKIMETLERNGYTERSTR